MKKVYSISIVMLLMTSMISCDRKPNQKINNNNETNILEHNTIKKKKPIELVSEYIKEEKIKQAVDLLEKMNTEGDYLAKYNLAKLYIRESYIKPNEIIGLLKESLKSKHKKYAAHLLGYLYFEGLLGVEKNYAEAFKYFKISGGNGHELKLDRIWNPFIFITKPGNYYLGMHYYKGLGTNQSKSMAFKYFDKTIGIASNPFAHFSDNKNIETSFQPEAEFMLGKMYYYGEGVSINIKMALYHIKRSYNSEYPEAIKFWDDYKLWKYKSKI